MLLSSWNQPAKGQRLIVMRFFQIHLFVIRNVKATKLTCCARRDGYAAAGEMIGNDINADFLILTFQIL